MVTMNTYKINYKRLVALGIHGEGLADCRRSVSGGFMDLIIERLAHLDSEVTDRAGRVYSLAHYFEQNGDLCSDPEMTIIVYPELELAEALTFQQAMPPIYQQVYPDKDRVVLAYKQELNVFLKFWLNNLRLQGHGRLWSE